MNTQSDPHARGFGLANGYMMSALLTMLMKNGTVSREEVYGDFSRLIENLGRDESNQEMIGASQVVQETLAHAFSDLE